MPLPSPKAPLSVAASSLGMPSHAFVNQVSWLTRRTLDQAQCALSCEGVVLTAEEVAAPDGLLPLLVNAAAVRLETLWGQQSFVFRQDSSALCGVVPAPTAPILPPSVWMHAVHFELDEAIRRAPEPAPGEPRVAVVDTWQDLWNQKAAANQLLVSAGPMGPGAAPGR